MSSTLTKSDSVPLSSSAGTTSVSTSEIPSSIISSQLVWMPNPDTSILAQLMASEASYQRTNQVLFGTNVTILIMAALFVTYHGFRKTMSRRSHSKLLADDSRGFGPSHTTVGGRLAGDELHNVVRESLDASPRSPGIGWVGEETLSSPVSTTSRIPLRGQHSAMWHSRFSKARWVLRTRGGGRFAEGAEEGRTLPTLNELSEIIGDCWYKLRAQGRDALASVSTLATKVSHRSNSNIGVDQRARERSLPLPNSARTTTFSTNSSIPTLPPYRRSVESTDGRVSPTPSSPSACCHDRRLHESAFQPIPALPDISSSVPLMLPPPLRLEGGKESTTVNSLLNSDSRRPRARERSLPALPRLSIAPVSSDISVFEE